MLDSLAKLATLQHAESNDPEILSRVSQYEMAYRMQSSVPEVADISDEPEVRARDVRPRRRRSPARSRAIA